MAIAAVPAYKVGFDRMALPTEPYAPGAQQALFRAPILGSRSDNHAVVRGDYRINSSNNILFPLYPRPSGVLWSADQWSIIPAQVSGGAGSRDRKLHTLRTDLER